jgi:hypothetical protein
MTWMDDLPTELGPHFLVGAARRAGVPSGRLRRADLVAQFHGTRTIADATEPAEDRLGKKLGDAEREHLWRAAAVAAGMGRHQFFTHITAAIAWGLPLPISVVRDADVHVGVLSPARSPRMRGVRGHQVPPHLTSIRRDSHTGLLLASPATTWAMLGAVLVDRDDIVAAGDAAVRVWRVAEPLTSMAQLGAAVDAGRRIGVGRLREALPLIRTRSASRPETRLRLLLLAAGLPEPELNANAFEGGRYLGCIDLSYSSLRIAIEYEGEHHLLDPEQWARDIQRYERLAAAGWTVIRVTKSDLFGAPAEVVARVRRAMLLAR